MVIEDYTLHKGHKITMELAAILIHMVKFKKADLNISPITIYEIQ
jgi:hypothetical protein